MPGLLPSCSGNFTVDGAGIGCADHTPSMIQLSLHVKLCHRTCNSAVVAWTGTRGLPSRVLALSLAGPVVPLWWVGKNLVGGKPPPQPLVLAVLLGAAVPPVLRGLRSLKTCTLNFALPAASLCYFESADLKFLNCRILDLLKSPTP